MKNKKRTKHDIAVNLCEGSIETIDGHAIRAIRIPVGFDACNECNMDSACSELIKEICIECDEYEGFNHILKFACNKRPH